MLVSPVVAMWPWEVHREGDLKKIVLGKKNSQWYRAVEPEPTSGIPIPNTAFSFLTDTQRLMKANETGPRKSDDREWRSWLVSVDTAILAVQSLSKRGCLVFYCRQSCFCSAESLFGEVVRQGEHDQAQNANPNPKFWNPAPLRISELEGTWERLLLPLF